MDPALLLEKQTYEISKKKLFFFEKKFSPEDGPDLAYQATWIHPLITFKLDYCNTFYIDILLESTQRFQLVQNVTPLLLLEARWSMHIALILQLLH